MGDRLQLSLEPNLGGICSAGVGVEDVRTDRDEGLEGLGYIPGKGNKVVQSRQGRSLPNLSEE